MTDTTTPMLTSHALPFMRFSFTSCRLPPFAACSTGSSSGTSSPLRLASPHALLAILPLLPCFSSSAERHPCTRLFGIWHFPAARFVPHISLYPGPPLRARTEPNRIACPRSPAPSISIHPIHPIFPQVIAHSDTVAPAHVLVLVPVPVSRPHSQLARTRSLRTIVASALSLYPVSRLTCLHAYTRPSRRARTHGYGFIGFFCRAQATNPPRIYA